METSDWFEWKTQRLDLASWYSKLKQMGADWLLIKKSLHV